MTVSSPGNYSHSPEDNVFKTAPPLLGLMLNWWLWGILIMQYVMYLNYTARKDNKYLLATVHFLVLTDTVQSLVTIADAFHWYVYNFGNYDAILDFPITNAPIFDAIIAIVVQLTYCWRIWTMSDWKVLPIMIALLAFIGCVSGFVTGISDRAMGSVVDLRHVWFIPIEMWLVASSLADILITSGMLYLLLRIRYDSQVQVGPNLLAVLRRLVILVLETNLITAAVALATLVMALIKSIGPPFTTFHIPGALVLGKLYSNSFIVLLNQRPSDANSGQITECSFLPQFRTPQTTTISELATKGEHSIMQFEEPTLSSD